MGYAFPRLAWERVKTALLDLPRYHALRGNAYVGTAIDKFSDGICIPTLSVGTSEQKANKKKPGKEPGFSTSFLLTTYVDGGTTPKRVAATLGEVFNP